MVGWGRPPNSFWGAEHNGADACRLGGNGVHNDRGGVDGQATGYIDASAAHGGPAVGQDGPGGNFDGLISGALGGSKGPGAFDGDFKPGPDLGIQGGNGVVNGTLGHAQGPLLYPVETGGELTQVVSAAGLYVLKDLVDGSERVPYKLCGLARDESAQLSIGMGAAAQVDGAQGEV